MYASLSSVWSRILSIFSLLYAFLSSVLSRFLSYIALAIFFLIPSSGSWILCSRLFITVKEFLWKMKADVSVISEFGMLKYTAQMMLSSADLTANCGKSWNLLSYILSLNLKYVVRIFSSDFLTNDSSLNFLLNTLSVECRFTLVGDSKAITSSWLNLSNWMFNWSHFLELLCTVFNSFTHLVITDCIVGIMFEAVSSLNTWMTLSFNSGKWVEQFKHMFSWPNMELVNWWSLVIKSFRISWR